MQHTRHATFAAHRSPSVRATPPAEAGCIRERAALGLGNDARNLPGLGDLALQASLRRRYSCSRR